MSGVCDMLEVYVRGMRYVGGICQGYVICWRYMSVVCDMLEVYVRGM